jgi:hypothetical protein
MKSIQFTKQQIKIISWILIQRHEEKFTESENKQFLRARRKFFRALKEIETNESK